MTHDTQDGAMPQQKSDILPADIKNLRHMLGAIPGQYTKQQWGFRNHFAAGRGQQQESMRRLEAAGLVQQGREGESMIFFHATEAGCKAAGMNRAQTKRALED